jgi:hypothetical protein
MISKKQVFLIIALAIIIYLLPQNSLLAQAEINTPVITEIYQPFYSTQPIVKGFAPSNTEVLIYVDGSLAGFAQVLSRRPEIDYFYFPITESLSVGSHKIMAVAKDRTSLVLSAPSREETLTIKPIPAPTLIAPAKDAVIGKAKPLITGLTINNTYVDIYIDGLYNGKTKIVKDQSGTANFAYYPFLNLNIGVHQVWAITEDEYGRVSQPSNILEFTVSKPLPAPIIYQPVVNKNTVYNKPFIVGLTKNNTTVKVYIDKKLDGEVKVTNHPSGTANFAYQPFVALKNGQHTVYTIAYDSRGKASIQSNTIHFNIGRISRPTITPVAAAAQAEPVVEQKIPPVIVKPGEKTKPAPGKIEVKPQIKDQEVKKLLETKIKSTSTDTGLITESKKSQNKLQLNLIIFILFLIAVILWIFWVNRELIKERREKNMNEKDKK